MSENKPEYVTKKQLAQDPSLCFTEAMLSYYILHRHKNGLSKAVLKIGRKLVIRKDLFIEWLEKQGGR